MTESLTDALKSADVPGVGQRDVTSPKTHLGLIAGSFVLFAGIGTAKYLFNQAKTSTSVSDVKDSVPVMGEL